VMFHHRPEHDDEQVDVMLKETREAAAGSGVEVVAAHEGMEITL